MARNFLITGGAGFIGSHLAELLLAEGNEVVVLDNLTTGAIANIRHLRSRPGFRCVIDDVENKPILAELVDDADYVVHLAAAVGVELIVESPVRTIETNVRGTEVLLDLAAKKKRPVLLASTSEVYGKSETFPYSEEGDLVIGPPTKGRWAYACSKALDEFLAIAYSRERGLPVVVVRLFNTVGPRQTGRYGMVVPRFVQQALANETITVYGDGTQSRCFGHVGDVVRALAQAVVEPRCYGGVFNVGSTEEVSINDLAKRVLALTGSRSVIQHLSYEEAYKPGFEDMQRRVPDVRKIDALLDWRVTKTLDDILMDVIEYEKRER